MDILSIDEFFRNESDSGNFLSRIKGDDRFLIGASAKVGVNHSQTSTYNTGGFFYEFYLDSDLVYLDTKGKRINMWRIGRNADNNIHVTDPSVSRNHCVICQKSSTYLIVDNSTNGTKVNGKMLKRLFPHILEDNSRIELGLCAGYMFFSPESVFHVYKRLKKRK